MSDAQFLVLLAVILLTGGVATDNEAKESLAGVAAGVLLGAAVCVAWIL